MASLKNLKDIPPIVIKHVQTLVPSSLFNDMTSFCIMPDSPNWPNKPSIAITTTHGELIEITNRLPTKNCIFCTDLKAIEVMLHYKKSFKQPNYIIRSTNNLFIVGHSEDDNSLFVITKFDNVTGYELKDTNNCGETQISVNCYGDLIPLVLNDNYEIEADIVFNWENNLNEDEIIVSVLMEQLTKARLNSANNMKILKDNEKLQQEIFHVTAESNKYNIDDIDKDDKIFDKITIGNIWQLIHNNKWIIGIPVENVSELDVEDVEVLLKNEDNCMFHYLISCYKRDLHSSLYWKKLQRSTIQSKENIVIIVESNVPKFHDSSNIKIKGSLKYKYDNQTYSPSLINIELKAIDVINGTLNAICEKDNFGYNNLLALYSTNLVSNLDIHFIKDADLSLSNLLINNLDYVNDVISFPNVFRYIKSPLHINYGSIIQITEEFKNKWYTYKVTIITRSESELFMLVNIMYDLLPSRIVIVPSGYEVKRKIEEDIQAMETESYTFIQDSNQYVKSDLVEFGCALYKEMSLVSDYLKDCLNAMSEERMKMLKKRQKVDNSININVMALGDDKYKEFWCKLRALNEHKNKILKNMSL